jgi:hypothetical protein
VPPKGALKLGRVQVKVYANDDDTYIVWETTPIPSCRGFAIYRREHGGTEELLTNGVGWRDDKKDPKVKDQPSTIWPFQTFTWADYKAHAGQVLSFPITDGSRLVFEPSDHVDHGGYFANEAAGRKLLSWLTGSRSA